jgi:hypothetical protein
MSKTYILTWNPLAYPWKEMEQQAEAVRVIGHLDADWTCGRTKRISDGDRIFLLRQREEPRGIVASGVAISSPYEQPHWDGTGRSIWFLRIRFDAIVGVRGKPLLPVSELQKAVPIPNDWGPRNSGQSIRPDAAEKLENLWRAFLKGVL